MTMVVLPNGVPPWIWNVPPVRLWLLRGWLKFDWIFIYLRKIVNIHCWFWGFNFFYKSFLTTRTCEILKKNNFSFDEMLQGYFKEWTIIDYNRRWKFYDIFVKITSKLYWYLFLSYHFNYSLIQSRETIHTNPFFNPYFFNSIYNYLSTEELIFMLMNNEMHVFEFIIFYSGSFLI
jgi:hypothetical protein